jgi:WD40 repeat protein
VTIRPATALGVTAYIWDVQTGRTSVLTGHSGAVTSVAFSPDGRRLLTGSNDRTARIWDIVSRQTLTVLTGHLGTVWSAGFSPDGRCVVTASADETARIWDAETGKSLTVLAGNSGIMKSAEFSPVTSRCRFSILSRNRDKNHARLAQSQRICAIRPT